MRELVNNDKILLRLSQVLTSAMDQVIREQVPHLNRSEFIRRAIRFTADNIDQFKESESLNISEKSSVESVEKINAVRDLYHQIRTYKDTLLQEPQTPQTIKQLAFLTYIVAEMIFKMNE